MEYLIKSGADVNRPLKHRIPLAEAAFENNLSCAKLLLKAGADVKVQRKYYAKFRKLPSREMTVVVVRCRNFVRYYRFHKAKHTAQPRFS